MPAETKIPDNSSMCPNCGAQVQRFAPPPPPVPGGPGITGATLPNYLVQSILVTFCCCMPAGIVAIVYSAQVNGKLAMGDVAGARDCANKAKMWGWIGFGLGAAGTLIYALFVGIAAVTGNTQ